MVRALANRLGVDLARVAATGPGGEVTAADVERAATMPGATGEPLRGVRRVMANNMARAHLAVAPATAMDQASLRAWLRPQANVMVRLVRAVIEGCRAEPALNAWYEASSQIRQIHDRIDLGIAVDTEDGLFVPVLRNAGALSGAEVRDEIDRLRSAVRARQVRPDELKGQTITLSNFGAIDGRFASLVVVPPQVAILGAGRVHPGLVATESSPFIADVLPLSLTFDHRVVTGGEAARFLATVIADLERPD
jgi:pyruvate dehydrogenase E2 component (dihydrolipoamide acetyltransferase)